ncbi:hypothetical protein PDIG_56890 [Penicillium digitatum PHI26]|uniref:Uncharacterized protein n=1 Tax=Penicillium digitatum (strain PHI26 / CECT 20796) TaxID=1170229 RepID=K9FLG1_PEND2|nr:hypothetical protein PDIG_56890 [Penicillium digitatum PHI26]
MLISIGCFGLGFILDRKSLSQRRRAQAGLYTVVILNVGVYVWSIIMQSKFKHHDPGAIDWDSGRCWTLMEMLENVRNGATFRCIEAIGQAIAYVSRAFSSCVTFALLGAALIPMIMLVNTTPDHIPADLVTEERNTACEKIRDV